MITRKASISMQPTPAKHVGSSLLRPRVPDQESSQGLIVGNFRRVGEIASCEDRAAHMMDCVLQIYAND